MQENADRTIVLFKEVLGVNCKYWLVIEAIGGNIVLLREVIISWNLYVCINWYYDIEINVIDCETMVRGAWDHQSR